MIATRRPVAAVVAQHVADAISLRETRTRIVAAAHVRLLHLARADERLSAHLDGVVVAGDFGSAMARAALASPGVGEVFVATIALLHRQDGKRLDALLALAATSAQACTGFVSALAWAAQPLAERVLRWLLADREPLRRRIGIAACGLRRSGLGDALAADAESADVALRARALRCIGEIGRRDLLEVCLDHLDESGDECRFHAARSAALLGEREQAPRALAQLALRAGPWRCAALATALPASSPDAARALVAQIARLRDLRLLVRAVGIHGDIARVPWLIDCMADDRLARLAGEAFSLVTGADLARLDLERDAPPAPVRVDETDDADRELDEDETLPWPDAARIDAWWKANAQRFAGVERCFMGSPPTPGHCRYVLAEGFQRQRLLAATWHCVLQPGSPLFPVGADSALQKELLARH